MLWIDWRGLTRLVGSIRGVLALSSIAHFSYSELAYLLDSTVCEVKKRLFAARELLKWKLVTDMKEG